MIGRIAALGSALLRVRKDSGNKKESNNGKTDLPHSVDDATPAGEAKFIVCRLHVSTSGRPPFKLHLGKAAGAGKFRLQVHRNC